MSAVEGPGAGAKPWGGRYRGVTKHKRTQRYEAHIWQCKKQLYLGGFDSEVLAAKSHGKCVEGLQRRKLKVAARCCAGTPSSSCCSPFTAPLSCLSPT